MLGWVVWILRLWLVFIDAMPMLFKVMLSLRARRPYDVAVARREEETLAGETSETAWGRSRLARQLAMAADAAQPRTSLSSRLEISGAQGSSVLHPGQRMGLDEHGQQTSLAHAAVEIEYEIGRGWVARAGRGRRGTGTVDLTESRDAGSVTP